MAQDYSRLQRADWDKLGPTVLALELFNLLSTAPATTDEPTGDGFYLKADESGSGATYELTLGAGGDGWAAGTVVSGSGTTYRVRLASGQQITATVPRALYNDDVTIPADSSAIVIKLSDGTYRLIASVWVTQAT